MPGEFKEHPQARVAGAEGVRGRERDERGSLWGDHKSLEAERGKDWPFF